MTDIELRNPFRAHVPEALETLRRLLRSDDPHVAFMAAEEYRRRVDGRQNGRLDSKTRITT